MAALKTFNSSMMSSLLPILFLLSLPLNSNVFASSLSFHQRKPRCELIKEPACQGKYSHTMMPNILGHDDQEEASLRFHEFDPLIESSCSKQLKFFLCSLHFPLCVPQVPEAITACRAMCEHVRDRCSPKMRLFQFEWPETINCSVLPEHTEKVRKCLHPDHPDERDDTNDETMSSDDVERPSVDDDVTGDVERDGSRGRRKQSGKKKKRGERRGKEAKDDGGRSGVTEYEVEDHDPEIVNSESHEPEIVNREDVVVEEEEDGDWLEHLPDTEQEEESSPDSSWIPKFPDVDDDELDAGYNIQQGNSYFFQNQEKNLQRCVNPDKFHYVAKMEKCLPLCDADIDVMFSSSDKYFAYFWMLTCSLLCLVSSAVTVGTFLIDSKRFRYPERPIIFLSLCYLLYSVAFFVRLGGGPTGSVSCVTKDDDVSYVVKGDLESTGCTAVFFLLYYFGMAASVWWVILSVTWFLAAGMKWGHEAIESYGFYFHLVAWLLPAVQTIVVLVTGKVDGDELTGMCYVGNLDPDSLLYYVIVPLTSYLAVGAIALGSGFGSLFKIRRVILTKSGEKDAGKLEKLMLKIGIFSVLYLVPTASVVAVNVHQYRSYDEWVSKAETWACNPPGFKNHPYSPYARYHRNVPEIPPNREDVYPFALYGDYYEGGMRFYDPRIPPFVPYVDPDGRYTPHSNDYGSMGYHRSFQDPDKQRGSFEFSGGKYPVTEAVVGPGDVESGVRSHDHQNYESRTIYNGVNLFRFNPSAYVQPDGGIGYYGERKHPLRYSSEVRRAFDAYAANVDVIEAKQPEAVTEKTIVRDCRLAESIPSFPIFAIKIFMSLLAGITSGIWVWSGKTYMSWKVFCTSCWCTRSKNKTIDIVSNTPPITSSGNVNAPPSVTSQLLRKCANSEQTGRPGSNRFSEPVFTAEDRLLPSTRSVHDVLPMTPEKYHKRSSKRESCHSHHLRNTDTYYQRQTEDDVMNRHGNATYVVTSQNEIERSRSCFKKSRRSRNGRRPASSGRLEGLTDQSNRAVPNMYEDASINRERVNRRHGNGPQKHFDGKKRVRKYSDSDIKKMSLVSEGGFKPISTSSRRDANSVNIGAITSV